jgi:hypothetical protein
MDIGRPQRTIIIEPIEDPVPRELPDEETADPLETPLPEDVPEEIEIPELVPA